MLCGDLRCNRNNHCSQHGQGECALVKCLQSRAKKRIGEDPRSGSVDSENILKFPLACVKCNSSKPLVRTASFGSRHQFNNYKTCIGVPYFMYTEQQNSTARQASRDVRSTRPL